MTEEVEKSTKNESYGCEISEESREHLSMQVNAAVARFISTYNNNEKTQPNKWFVKNIYGLQCKIAASRRFLALWHAKGKSKLMRLHMKRV